MTKDQLKIWLDLPISEKDQALLLKFIKRVDKELNHKNISISKTIENVRGKEEGFYAFNDGKNKPVNFELESFKQFKNSMKSSDFKREFFDDNNHQTFSVNINHFDLEDAKGNFKDFKRERDRVAEVIRDKVDMSNIRSIKIKTVRNDSKWYHMLMDILSMEMFGIIMYLTTMIGCIVGVLIENAVYSIWAIVIGPLIGLILQIQFSEWVKPKRRNK